MKAMAYALLGLSGVLALPLLLNLAHPLWWHQWFARPNAPPTPQDVAAAISWGQISGGLAVVCVILGLVILSGSGRSSNPPPRRKS